jgi:hypothetical protein
MLLPPPTGQEHVRGNVRPLDTDHLCSPSLGYCGFPKEIIPAHGVGVQGATEPQDRVPRGGQCPGISSRKGDNKILQKMSLPGMMNCG